MGKLLFSRLMILTCLLLSLIVKGQEDSYYVFHVTGEPMLNDSLVLAKGMFVAKDNFLTLGENDELLLSDQNGALYEIKKKVTLPYGRIAHYKKKEVQENGVVKYLKFVWKKLWEKRSNDNVGVVFRASNSTIPLYPLDSVSVFGKELNFSWKPTQDGGRHYFYLQQAGSEQMLKLATNGTYLELPIGGDLLENGKEYQWAISSDDNQEAAYLEFLSFDLMNQEDFETRMKEYKPLIAEFEALGVSEEIIKESLCRDLNFCFD
ncbi:hypothetical protein [Croceivirga thetidis]|uniref:Uncharacterized protein n=1 Tax=Croceivirga thetidis TaxID=2721623 RepID=A0ABX1GPV8_9FLAO|nr:hypothetical protein [Croceivirga thetidis]NKI30990.1 hypothetical protein [Croceivirga thetidis]